MSWRSCTRMPTMSTPSRTWRQTSRMSLQSHRVFRPGPVRSQGRRGSAPDSVLDTCFRARGGGHSQSTGDVSNTSATHAPAAVCLQNALLPQVPHRQHRGIVVQAHSCSAGQRGVWMGVRGTKSCRHTASTTGGTTAFGGSWRSYVPLTLCTETLRHVHGSRRHITVVVSAGLHSLPGHTATHAHIRACSLQWQLLPVVPAPVAKTKRLDGDRGRVRAAQA